MIRQIVEGWTSKRRATSAEVFFPERTIFTASLRWLGLSLEGAVLKHVSPIEWENVVLYGQYVLNRRLVRVRDG